MFKCYNTLNIYISKCGAIQNEISKKNGTVRVDCIACDALFWLAEAGLRLVCCLAIRGSTDGFLLLRVSVVLLDTLGISRCHNTLFLSTPYH